MAHTVGRTLEAEDDGERRVQVAELTRAQPAGRPAQAFRTDGGRLLDEHARRCSCQFDRRPPRPRWGRCRGWRYEHRRQGEKLLGLNDDCISGAPLLAATRASRNPQAEHFASHHGVARSPARARRLNPCPAVRAKSRRDRPDPTRLLRPPDGGRSGGAAAPQLRARRGEWRRSSNGLRRVGARDHARPRRRAAPGQSGPSS
jgi:hypothetical protein